MFINVIISSKNYKSIIFFLRFFFKFCLKHKIKFNKLFFKHFQNNHQIIKFKTLKSPHIYKKAQKQFKYYLFSKKFQIVSFQILKFLIMLKKVEIVIFSDIKIQIKFLLNNNKFLIKEKKILNPDKFSIKTFNNIKKSNCYLNLFDFFGEFYIKNLNSSEVEHRTENPRVDSSKLSLNI